VLMGVSMLAVLRTFQDTRQNYARLDKLVTEHGSEEQIGMRFRDYADRLGRTFDQFSVLLALASLAFAYAGAFDRRNLTCQALSEYLLAMLVLLAVWAFLFLGLWYGHGELLRTAVRGLPAARQTAFRTANRWRNLLWERIRYSVLLRLAAVFALLGLFFWGLALLFG